MRTYSTPEIADHIASRKLGSKSAPPKLADRDDTAWTDRSEFWLQKVAPKTRQFTKRAGVGQPLILNGHGVRLRIDHGSLWVQNGFTHYPQEREEWRFFSGDWRLPSRIVLLDADGTLSIDAFAWLARHRVPLLQINWRGEVLQVVGDNATAIDPKLAKAQLAARGNGRGLRIARHLILGKITNAIETLQHVLPKSATADAALAKLRRESELIRKRPPLTVNNLLGVEGRAGLAYFRSWCVIPMCWKGVVRRPIPDDWNWVGRRTSKVAGPNYPNRNATHPFSAMLNYAYAILESQVRMQVVAAGYDPTIGFLHGNYGGKHAFVYDLMEPLRPRADRKLLEFVQTHTFSPGDFTLTSDGICRLNPQLARHVVKVAGHADGLREYLLPLLS